MSSFGMSGWGMGIGWLIPLLFIVVIFYLFKDKKENFSSKEILDQRYANGEIDTQEYQERVIELQKMEKEL